MSEIKSTFFSPSSSSSSFCCREFQEKTELLQYRILIILSMFTWIKVGQKKKWKKRKVISPRILKQKKRIFPTHAGQVPYYLPAVPSFYVPYVFFTLSDKVLQNNVRYSGRNNEIWPCIVAFVLSSCCCLTIFVFHKFSPGCVRYYSRLPIILHLFILPPFWVIGLTKVIHNFSPWHS